MSQCTTFAFAPVDSKDLTSYLIAMLVFALSVTICEMFTEIIKFKKNYHDNEGQGQEFELRDLRHSTGNVRLHIGELFWILATRRQTFAQK